MSKAKVNWESFKEYSKESWTNQIAEWKSWKWYEWVAQTSWLIILVSMFAGFLYGFEYVGSNPDVNPNGPIGALLSISPLLMVAAIFLAHWLYGKFVRFVFQLFNV